MTVRPSMRSSTSSSLWSRAWMYRMAASSGSGLTFVIVASVILALLIWRKRSRVAAGITLVWIALEVALKLVAQVQSGASTSALRI